MSLLKTLREKAGLRREDLAAQARISYDYVRKLEGENPPSPGLQIARRVAETLGTTVDKVFPK